MQENRFMTAGWAAIVAAVIFPLAFVIEGLQEAIFALEDLDYAVGIGPADFLWLAFAALSIYVYISFKKLMYEYYSFKKIGAVINATIGWHIVFFGGSFLLELLLVSAFSPNDIGPPLVLTIFWVIGIVVFGIIDIIIGIILLRHTAEFSGPVKAVAVLSLVIGICEASVILSPITLLLVPAFLVAMAFVFLRKVDEVEFV